MADWYASSVAHAAVPQWAATTAYTVGQFLRALAAPAQPYQQYVHRCTTAGTTGASEPAWNGNNNGTTTSGTAVFTNVAGQSAYGWAAAAGNLVTLGGAGVARSVAGDRVFVSSDHSESYSGSFVMTTTAGWIGLSVISVNKAGSVPPVAADVQAGAIVNLTNTPSQSLEAYVPMFWQGITFNWSPTTVWFNGGGTKSHYFKDCAIKLINAGVSLIASNNPSGDVTFDNTTLQVANVGSGIAPSSYSFNFTWLNTPSAIQGATIPTNLFRTTSNSGSSFTLRGVDLSALTTTIFGTPSTAGVSKGLLDSCRIASGVTRMYTPGAGNSSGDSIELVNCFDGTNVVNERHRSAGVLTTERSTTMSGGATDGSGAFSFKLVSSARSDKFVEALDTFFLDVENLAIGSAKTATVEIVSSASLNNDDVFLTLEYLGTASSTLAVIASSKPTSVSSTALPTSGVTWLSPPGTPVKQYLQVTFTPLTTGRVRGRVNLGKPSTTIWVNPQMAIAAPPIIVTWNPADKGSSVTLSGGDLTMDATGNTTNTTVRATLPRTTGKYYFEVTWTGTVSSQPYGCIGVAKTTAGFNSLGNQAGNAVVRSGSGTGGDINAGGGATGYNVGASAAGDVICVAIDFTNGRIWFRRNNGLWNGNGTADPVANVNGVTFAAANFAGGDQVFPAASGQSTAAPTATANFGATAFAFSKPTGFSAWNSAA